MSSRLSAEPCECGAGSDSHAHAAASFERSAGGDQHAREPRMQRQALHLAAERRDLTILDRADPLEQRHRRGDAIGGAVDRTIRTCPGIAPHARIDSSGPDRSTR